MGPLLRAFLEVVERPVAAAMKPRLETALESAHRAARDAFPAMKVEPRLFAKDLARVLGPGPSLTDSELEKLRAAEIFLASHCLRAVPAALDALERGYLPRVRAAMARQVRDEDTLNDLLQSFRERLLLGDAPLLAKYAGRGALSAWLCAIGVRQSLDFLRANKRLVLQDEVEAVGGGVASNQELAYAQKRWASEFQAALRKAFALLSREERRLLRHAHLDGLGIDAIAQATRVHRSTAARQLNKARERLITLTRDAMREELGLSEAALDSLTRSVHVDLDVSLSAALGASVSRRSEG